jgi:hypothetical protein
VERWRRLITAIKVKFAKYELLAPRASGISAANVYEERLFLGFDAAWLL